MFIGHYEHTVDDKGRLIIPSDYRKLLGKLFVLVKGLDKAITIYPKDEWEKEAKRLSSFSYRQKHVRDYVRPFYASATKVSLDRQGRICIPITLRKEARIQKEVVINGMGSFAEIWAREEWDRFKQEADAVYEERAELLEEI